MNRPISASALASDAHGWTVPRRAETGRLLRAARRHSRLVRILRFAVPGGVALVLAGYVAVSYFDPLRMLEKLPNVSGKLTVSGSKITMEMPKIAGFTRDNRPYEFTAATAIQDILNPDMVDLKDIRATILTADQNVVQIAAQNGVYNTKADQIVLRDHVIVITTGFHGKMREAAVDMKQGKVVSEQPVEVTLPEGVIKANRMEVLESGELIRFERGVVVTLDGESTTASAATPATAGTPK
jgi:lipopolysaccharide export system protein LptC